MRPLFVCLNAKYVHASPAPYLLRAGVRRYGKIISDAEILDSTVNEDESRILDQILSFSPDFIGFSTYIWNVRLVLSLVRRVKEHLKDVFICLGGPEVAASGAILLSTHSGVDFILEGEGERSLPALLDALASGEDLRGIDGLSYRLGEEIRSTPPRPHNEWLSPLSGGYAEALGNRIAYLETSRGCPFRCAFCLSGEDRALRMTDAREAVEQITCVASLGARTVKLVDRTFNADPKRALFILKELAERSGADFPRDVTFHFELSGELLDEETILLLSSAPLGLFQLELGLQSTSPAVLSAIGRSPHYERTLDAARRISESGRCHVHLDLIAGLPHETRESWERGFIEALAARPQMLQLGFLKLLPGTRLDRERQKYGLISASEPPYEVIETTTLSHSELRCLHRFEAAFDRLYNSGRHKRTLEYLFHEANISPLHLFSELGDSLAVSPASGLDALCERILTTYGNASAVNRDRLLDAMRIDRVVTNQNTHLPPFLRKFDPRISLHRAAHKDGVARGYASLSDGRLLVARYTRKNPVSGEYDFEEIGDLHE